MASQGRGAKQKGASAELKIAKILGEWSGENVHRVPQSGAGGTRFGTDTRMVGDITFPVNSQNCFVYESKKQEGWELANLFKGTGKIKEWFNQVVDDARRMKSLGMSPCLMFSKNRDIIYVLIPYTDEFYEVLDKSFPVSRQTVSYKDLRDEEQSFDTLLTTIEGFTSVDKYWLFDLYRNLEWDIRNN
ncbi:holliday junction resolvase [Bacillus phage Kamfam]|nr:holliday junction resolvase [Bacillus phage OTooleKemple52]AXQ67223.1 holliday junction resolvase [Bacillus phage Kamfam]